MANTDNNKKPDNKPYEVVETDLSLTGEVDKSAKVAYELPDRSAISAKISADEAKRGIVLSEVLGPPLSKRGRGRRWN